MFSDFSYFQLTSVLGLSSLNSHNTLCKSFTIALNHFSTLLDMNSLRTENVF